MRGRILRYSFQAGSGSISGDDGVRYSFKTQDWSEDSAPAQGMYVDFDTRVEPDTQAHLATEIFAVAEAPVGAATNSATSPIVTATSNPKDKITAAWLAFFLGGFGAHKFYLGEKGGVGRIILTCTIIGALISGPLALIDFIKLMQMDDATFNGRYNSGQPVN